MFTHLFIEKHIKVSLLGKKGLKQFLNNSRTTLKSPENELFDHKIRQIVHPRDQISKKEFVFRGNLSTFRAENTAISRSSKSKTNYQTLPNDPRTFERVQILKLQMVKNYPLKNLRLVKILQKISLLELIYQALDLTINS